MRMRVRSQALFSGLGIWHCCELWCRSQMGLGSCIAVAVVLASSCSSDSIHSLGTSICCRCGPKKKKKNMDFWMRCACFATCTTVYLNLSKFPRWWCLQGFLVKIQCNIECEWTQYSMCITGAQGKLVSVFAFSFFLSLFIYLFLSFSEPHPWHMEVPRLGGPLGAVAAGLRHNHSNAGSKLRLRPTPQLTATLSP